MRVICIGSQPSSAGYHLICYGDQPFRKSEKLPQKVVRIDIDELPMRDLEGIWHEVPMPICCYSHA